MTQNSAKHVARKRFGQNFLQDPHVLHKILDALHLRYEDHVVEIGPGLGALTKLILPKLKSLDAIEIDRDLIFRLEKLAESVGHLNLFEKDALKVDFGELIHQSEPLRIVGNLPYNITTPLLFHLFQSINLIEDMHFMLQKEVAERICAHPNTKTYGRLSVMTQYYCEVEILFGVPPQAFQPQPKVFSSFIRLKPHQNPSLRVKNSQMFSDLVRHAFNQRRKILKNSVKELISEQELKAIGIDPNSRPEQLSIENFVKISNAIKVKEFE